MSDSNRNYADRPDDLAPDLKPMDDQLARLGEIDRGAAPPRLRDALDRATPHGVAHHPAPPRVRRRTRDMSGGSIPLLRRVSSPAFRAAAVIGLLASGAALLVWSLQPSPTKVVEGSRDATHLDPDLEAEIELLALSDDTNWPALSGADLDRLEYDAAALRASRDAFWLDFDDPLVEDSL